MLASVFILLAAIWWIYDHGYVRTPTTRSPRMQAFLNELDIWIGAGFVLGGVLWLFWLIGVPLLLG